MRHKAQARPLTRRLWFLVAVAAAIAFIANGARLSFGVYVVPLSDAFDVGRSQVMLPFVLSMAMWGLAQPIAGMLLDSRGPRLVILGALVLLVLGFVVSASARNLWQLTLGYGLLVGIADSGLAVAAFSILISRWFEKERRGRALGLVLGAIPAGGVVFAPLASALAYGVSWRFSFLALAGIVAVVAFPLAWFFLKGQAASTTNVPRTSAGGLFSRDVVRAVKTRPYWVLLLAYFGCGSAGFFLQGHLAALALRHGFSPGVGALGLSLIGLGGSLGAILGGWAADRYGRFKVLAIGYFVRGVGFILLTFFVSNKATFFLATLVAAAPIYVTITATQALIYEIFGAGIAGRMLGFTFVLHQVGSSIGPWLGGRLYESSGDYTLALMLGAGVLFASSVLTAYLPITVKKSAYVPAEPAARAQV